MQWSVPRVAGRQEAAMTASQTPTTTPISRRVGRRIGYLVAILVNLGIYWFVNVWPGWQSFSFVTNEATDVVPLINLSLAVTILVNLVYVIYDGYRIKALGEAISSTVMLFVSYVVLDVFPFDFSAYAFPWTLLARIFLVVAIAGSGISMIVNLDRLIRGPHRPRRTPPAKAGGGGRA
jgi:hypothetical protein